MAIRARCWRGRRERNTISMVHLAHAYLHDAAVLKAAPKPSGGFYEEPVRFLYFHTIELFLKAYLRLQDVEESELGRQPYSHSLTNLADEVSGGGW